MHSLTFRITTLSPLVLAARGGVSHFTDTRDYIRGTIILGMFAGRYITKHGLKANAHDDEVFSEWFLHGPLSFGNAYIDSIDHRGDEVRNDPIPLSIRLDKNNPTTAYQLLLTQTQNQTAAAGSYGRLQSTSLYRQGVKKALNYHHQHDPEKGIVKKGVFFNYESIAQGQSFTGDITGDEKTLTAFKQEFKKDGVLYVGRSKNTQYGKIKLEFISGPALRQQSVRVSGEQVLMTLRSPLILYNSSGFSTTNTDELLKLLRDIVNPSIQIDKAFIKAGVVENFLSVWKLKRPVENCFNEGSTFLLSGIGPEDGPTLDALIDRGLGERRKEGFGRVAFVFPTDRDMEPFTDMKIKEPDIPTPTSFPETAQRAIEHIVKDVFRGAVRTDALEKSAQFKPLRSKSLLSRLTAILNTRGKSVEDFKKSLRDDLRKTARDHMEACDNGRITLFDFIQEEKLSVSRILNRTDRVVTELNRLLADPLIHGDIKGVLNIGGKFEEELYKLYFETFFTAMRKRVQAKEEVER